MLPSILIGGVGALFKSEMRARSGTFWVNWRLRKLQLLFAGLGG